MVYPPQRTVDELLNSMTATYVTGSSTISGSTVLVGSGGLSVSGNASITGSTYLAQYGTDYGTVLRLDFEEGSGSMAFDSSPYGNDGAITGATWAAGKYGSALSFDGTGDCINLASVVSTPSAFTILGWWKRLGDSSGSGGDANHCIFDGINGSLYNWFGVTKTGDAVKVSIYVDPTNYGAVKSISDVAAWHQVGGLWNGSNLYAIVDGVFGEPVVMASISTDVTLPKIGQFNATIYLSNGIIDEVCVYDRALSADEIRTLWLSSTAKHTSSTIISDKFRVLGTDLSTKLTLTDTDLSMGAGVSFSPPTGSASGSLVASLTMAVVVTGSTYYIQLWK